MTRLFFCCCFLALAPSSGLAQTAPPLDDFVALASKDEKVSQAAADRLTPVWKDTYSAMVIDLARFFRPQREAGAPERGDDELGSDDVTQAGRANGSGQPITARTQTPEAAIRGRLMRFLSKRTGKSFGNDLKLWRKWSWTLADDPHPEYSEFKARLYSNVDPRMASFFTSSEKPRIRLDEIDWGGVAVNGIPPLDQPKTITAEQATFMGDKNVVFGLVVDGAARAYPKRILAWHEMALDTLGGVKLAVVYCTLCGTVIPYETVVDGRSFTLGTSGLLYRSNKLMFDLETKSLWSTIEGRPVVGALAASPIVLKYRPVVTTTWKEWRAAHPDTTVLSLDTGYQRDYDEGVAYRTYFSHDDLMFEVPVQDKRLKRKAEVVTFVASGESKPEPVALDTAFLKKNPLHAFTASGIHFIVVTSDGGANRIYRTGAFHFVSQSEAKLVDAAGSEWKVQEDRLERTDGESLPREPARRTFWFAWVAQFPETTLVK
ncbi:MAG: DUF3179 domain-containing protein [Vicinamibacteria bacterium]